MSRNNGDQVNYAWQSVVSPARNNLALCCGLAGYLLVPPLLFALFPGCGIAVKLFLPSLLGIAAVTAVLSGGDSPAQLPKKAGLGRMRWRATGFTIGFMLPLTIAVGVTTSCFQLLLKKFGIDFAECQPLLEFAAQADATTLVLVVLAVCVLVPIAEELLFRRAMFGALLPLGETPALIFTALIFALCHGFLLGLPGLFLLGAGFQYLYRRYQNLAYPLLAHAFFNFIPICAVLLSISSGGQPPG